MSPICNEIAGFRSGNDFNSEKPIFRVRTHPAWAAQWCMNSGRTIFAQLMAHAPHKEFQKCVARYEGDRYLKRFSCWDQYLAMSFAQLTYRESLRDSESCLRSMRSKLYHMGLRGAVARSTLAEANENRD